MSDLENFKLLGIALALGLLIGLERGWRERDRGEGQRIAGLRTYGLISLLGGVSSQLAMQTGPFILSFVFISVASILLVAYSKNLERFADVGITSIIASLLSFILGALAALGHVTLASSSAVVTTLLLGFKPLLHNWVNKLDQLELEATLKLLLISVAILPILPDQGFGPWKALNPYHIWWMVVLIAGISYLGYFAVRIAGDRHGPVLTGAFGGLVSSTVVTINLARYAKSDMSSCNALAAGTLTACATMFARTLVLASIGNPELALAILPALLIMSTITYSGGFLFWLLADKTKAEHQTLAIKNPFQLGMALKFGIFLSLILLLSKILRAIAGDLGTYTLACIAGIADVDPITLSMAQLSREGMAIHIAGTAILLAVSVNTTFKGFLSEFLGGRKLGLKVGGVLILALCVGLAVHAIS